MRATSLPSASRTITIAPASVLPVSSLPSSLSSADGASGIVVSGAVALAAGDSLLAASVWVTDTPSPLVNAGLISTEKLPFASTTPVPISLPAASLTLTVAPASPLPVSTAPSSVNSRLVGASGAVRSGAVAFEKSETLLASSVAWILTTSPLVNGGLTTKVKLPSASALPAAISLPFESVTTIFACGSVVTTSLLPSSLKSASGASGAVKSGALAVLGAEVLPLLSV